MNSKFAAAVAAGVFSVGITAPNSAHAVADIGTTTVTGCQSGVYVTTDTGTHCYVDGASGGSTGSGGGGGGGGYAEGGGGGGGTGLAGVTLAVPGVPGATMNATATKIKAPNHSLSDDPLVRLQVVKAANGVPPNGNKPANSICTVYYGTGETEKWIKGEGGTSSMAWAPIPGSQTSP